MDPTRKTPDSESLNSISPPPSDTREEDEALDWDFQLEVKSTRRSGVIQANVEHVGRAKPIPLADPGISSVP
jgi:hypothetical protein